MKDLLPVRGLFTAQASMAAATPRLQRRWLPGTEVPRGEVQPGTVKKGDPRVWGGCPSSFRELPTTSPNLSQDGEWEVGVSFGNCWFLLGSVTVPTGLSRRRSRVRVPSAPPNSLDNSRIPDGQVAEKAPDCPGSQITRTAPLAEVHLLHAVAGPSTCGSRRRDP